MWRPLLLRSLPVWGLWQLSGGVGPAWLRCVPWGVWLWQGLGWAGLGPWPAWRRVNAVLTAGQRWLLWGYGSLGLGLVWQAVAGGTQMVAVPAGAEGGLGPEPVGASARPE